VGGDRGKWRTNSKTIGIVVVAALARLESLLAAEKNSEDA
jgi:hypothetical protein